MLIPQTSPKLQSIIQTILTLSPQEQFDLIVILLQTVWSLPKGNNQPPLNAPSPKAGSAKGLVIMADNFDAPLEEFKEYM